MINLIEKMEEIKRYGHIQQIHWNQAHFQRADTGAVSLHVPITTHTNKQRRETIETDMNAAAERGQRVIVKIDPLGSQSGFVQLHQKLTPKSAGTVEAELRRRGVNTITNKGFPWESMKGHIPEVDRKGSGLETAEIKRPDWSQN